MTQPSLATPGRIRFIDSHTAGEPTRTVLSGFPALPGETLAEQRLALAGAFGDWRTLVNNEPRGSDVLVSALLVPPKAPDCAAGVIFFNNVGVLGMCGHGTMGVVATLAHLGQLQPGQHRIDTPAGVVTATLHGDGRVSVANVRSYRHRARVTVNVPGAGVVEGDVAYGGNWFFLTSSVPASICLGNVERLTDHAWRIREALHAQGITGQGGEVIDHIELMEMGDVPRNFVLCPGKAYDRSPCGTGTSAKLACLAADGHLAPGVVWRQQSVIGSEFQGSYVPARDRTGILPTITGQAFVTVEGELIAAPGDPFLWGIPAVGAGSGA